MAELLTTDDMVHIIEKWMTSTTTMNEDLETWGISSEAFREVAASYVESTWDEMVQGKLRPSEGFLDLFFAGFQLGYLFRLEVESRTIAGGTDE